jgi:hypothetical protein
MSRLEEVKSTAPQQKCPDCGSLKVGVGEMSGYFGLVCGDCRWTVGKESTKQEAYDNNADVLLRWDHGYRLDEPAKRVEETIRMVNGEKQKPNVGALTLQAVAKSYGGDVRDVGSPFRTEEEQKRLEDGQPVAKQYVCENCKSTQQGAEVSRFYYAMPAGWYLQHPSARLFCSLVCVKEDKERG